MLREQYIWEPTKLLVKELQLGVDDDASPLATQ